MARPRGKKSQAQGKQTAYVHSESMVRNAPFIESDPGPTNYTPNNLKQTQEDNDSVEEHFDANSIPSIKAVEEMLHALCEEDLQ